MRCAIIGLACIFPGAPDAATFWRNIVDGVDSITDVPAGRWDAQFYDPASTDIDRFYCKRGGFVDQYADFDPLSFGVMPNATESIEPDQLLTLKIGYEALRDSGYADRDFARARTGIIIGRGNYVGAGVLRLEQHVRLLPQILQTLRDLFPDLPQAALDDAKARLQAQCAYYGPDVASGLIPNLLASRLANRLDLHGPAYTIDAACASSLIAVEQACAALARGETDMMLAGGAHLTHDLTFWATFCQLGALSRAGMSRPLSSEADGILAGEGVGMVVLKRLDDAVTDGDRIYAVIEGSGSSSDGRSGSLVAPAADGQIIALEKAWAQAGLSRSSIGLLEAHGTGTPTGDAVELDTVRAFFGKEGSATTRPVVGSVKSMIGHAMPASGMASLIKTALAIHHGILPPTLHCGVPSPLLEKTGFRVIQRAESWNALPEQRIAAVNAFGFGGINAHTVLRGMASSRTGIDLPQVLMFAAETQAALLLQLDAGTAGRNTGHGAWRLVIIAPDAKKLETARKVVAAGKPWNGRQQIWFSPDGLLRAGKLAFVFPGVGTSFQPRTDNLAAYFGVPLPAACAASDPGQKLGKTVLGLLAFNRYIFDRVVDLGLHADAFAGHSVGEWSAMVCAGMIDHIVADGAMSGVDLDAVTFPDVRFLAAACSADILTESMAGLEHISLSHDNCPHQAIACGMSDSVEALAARLKENSIFYHTLPIISGFHSPMFADYMQAYRDVFCNAHLDETAIPVWSATRAAKFPSDMADKRQLALDHLIQPVRFRDMIEAMHADGCRVFLELGTGSLTGFIADTLAGKPHHAVVSNHEERGGLAQLQAMSAALWVEGAVFDTRLLTGATRSTQPSASTRRLQLGVGLVRLSEPLDTSLLPMRFQPADVRPAANVNDPVGMLIVETLADIERAGREVLSLWQLRQSSAGTRINCRTQRLLDIETTIPYVKDHEFYQQRPGWPIVSDRRPIVPMTMEAMLIRDAVEEALPGLKVTEMSGLQAYKWLDVSDPVTVDIALESIDDTTIDAQIIGYFKARVTVARTYPHPDAAPAAPLRNPRATEADAVSLYDDRWMFHGPAYQGVSAFGAIGDNGIDAELRVTAGKGALLDNMGQVAGYWVMEQPTDCLAMPIGIGRVRFFAPDPLPGETLRVEVRIAQLDGLNCVSNHVLRDTAGNVRIAIEGWHTRRYRIDRPFWLNLRKAGRTAVSQAVPHNVMLLEDHYDTAIVRDYIARSYLTMAERDIYDSIAPRRRRQWLSGRVAAKDAVLAYLRQEQGGVIFPQELRIENDAAGVPRVRANITDAVSELLHVSISHKDHLAAAIVGAQAVGIDIERIEARTEQFLTMVFTPAERALLVGEDDSVAFTRGWVVKEVVGKQAGTGLAGRPHDFVIQARDGDCFCVNGTWVVTHVLRDHVVGWSLKIPAAHDHAGDEQPPYLQSRLA